MELRHLRNATLTIRSAKERLLVDPMLGPEGSLPPLAFLRYRPRRNPLVPLPPEAHEALEGVTGALITHCRRGHLDHLDGPGVRKLRAWGVPVYCSVLDAAHLRRKGLAVVPLERGVEAPFCGGTITPIPTVHGFGLIGRLMGPGVGYHIALPGEPSLYLTGDTVLTPTVRRAVAERRPDVVVVAAGVAQLDVGRPILMPLEEILELVRLAPGAVVACHLEALNHCPMTRRRLVVELEAEGLSDRVWVPQDGERRRFEAP